MSDFEMPPPEDADRDVEFDDDLDPEAPTDSTLVHPPRDDADRPVPGFEEPVEDALPPGWLGGADEPWDAFQEENAASSLDQPSGQTS